MDLKPYIREIPDFPKEGVSFKDITTLLKDKEAFRYAVNELASKVSDLQADLVVSPEARGFMIGGALAYKLGLGFIPVRKAGKLPCEAIKGTYTLEYGEDCLELHKDAIGPGRRVIVCDDLLATGGTTSLVIDMIEKLGGSVAATAFLIELTYLQGREALRGHNVVSLIQY
jgi:adenine phosphoribosyltransferase